MKRVIQIAKMLQKKDTMGPEGTKYVCVDREGIYRKFTVRILLSMQPGVNYELRLTKGIKTMYHLYYKQPSQSIFTSISIPFAVYTLSEEQVFEEVL